MEPLKNAKHEHFARLVSNGESLTRAYILAGYSKNGAVQSARRLLTNAHISGRIEFLRSIKEQKHAEAVDQVIKEFAIDKAWVMAQLIENVKMAKKAEPVLDQDGTPIGEYKQNIAAANRALELLGKEIGMFVEKKEIRAGELEGLQHDELKQLRDALSIIGADGKAEGTFTQRTNGTTH
jgi:phage terminase small subunit